MDNMGRSSGSSGVVFLPGLRILNPTDDVVKAYEDLAETLDGSCKIDFMHKGSEVISITCRELSDILDTNADITHTP